MTSLPTASATLTRSRLRLRRLVEKIRGAARARRALVDLDARTLRDIGLTRQDVQFFRFERNRG